jgi:hypothetical protein
MEAELLSVFSTTSFSCKRQIILLLPFRIKNFDCRHKFHLQQKKLTFAIRGNRFFRSVLIQEDFEPEEKMEGQILKINSVSCYQEFLSIALLFYRTCQNLFYFTADENITLYLATNSFFFKSQVVINPNPHCFGTKRAFYQ